MDDDNLVDLSNDDNDASIDASKARFTEMQLTLPVVDAEVLVCTRTIMTLRSLFTDEPLVEKVDPPPSGSIVETKMVKKARQSCDGCGVRASFLSIGEDIHLARMQTLEENLDKLNQSNLKMQTALQQILADQARENNKMM